MSTEGGVASLFPLRMTNAPLLRGRMLKITRVWLVQADGWGQRVLGDATLPPPSHTSLKMVDTCNQRAKREPPQRLLLGTPHHSYAECLTNFRLPRAGGAASVAASYFQTAECSAFSGNPGCAKSTRSSLIFNFSLTVSLEPQAGNAALGSEREKGRKNSNSECIKHQRARVSKSKQVVLDSGKEVAYNDRIKEILFQAPTVTAFSVVEEATQLRE
ncbi:hypothetical protein HPB51_003307 [Rhipicephalus microplus]|uniref:Uncharacterized protein n=1 Tax=Rhipicephalus microplus TaxID=6941 RepID=A0A9J6D8K6_RHIMP|nr:hypothetical protein HPB51_003307 [Rhipicephalus microplus]